MILGRFRVELEACRKAKKKTGYLQLDKQLNDRDIRRRKYQGVDKSKRLESLLEETSNVEGKIKNKI